MSQLRLLSLGSGSSGNGFILDTGQIAFLIDCGTAVRPAQAAIRELGIADRLAGIIVSHEHSDHIRSIPSITRRRAYPLITTRGTFSAMRSALPCVACVSGTIHIDSGVEVTFVGVSHDANEPCGFVIDAHATRIAVFTDLGFVDDAVLDALRSADIIVLESNYDREMLRRGGYPAHLKRRIQGPAGHLSNDDCATALVASVSGRTQAIWLAHLSHNNNAPHVARRTTEEALALQGVSVPVRPLPRFDHAEITTIPSHQPSLGIAW